MTMYDSDISICATCGEEFATTDMVWCGGACCAFCDAMNALHGIHYAEGEDRARAFYCEQGW